MNTSTPDPFREFLWDVQNALARVSDRVGNANDDATIMIRENPFGIRASFITRSSPSIETIYELDFERDELKIDELPASKRTCRMLDYDGLRCTTIPANFDICDQHIANVLDEASTYFDRQIDS